MKINKLQVYNTLKHQKEIFSPLAPPRVTMYLCGPTVYGYAHIGHARSAITFDIIFRYLQHLGYHVRYVRNITDVGHLMNDSDNGEDKIAQKAKKEQLEPMEVVQYYTNSYRRDMTLLNVLPPSIEPNASGHITEQIELIQQIIKKGYAYVVNGSVYFNIAHYHKLHHYGQLSGRIIEDLYHTTRTLYQQQEKNNALDFALWKKASPQHIMRWPSPWGEGFPGWHIECTAMSTKYLGKKFDIHGGGMDLLFPHHECELAQAYAAYNISSAQYWMHNNMVTIGGKKMGKSLGNCITLQEIFQGSNPWLDQAYMPMVLRFCILQAHYRSTLNFSIQALKAAQKAYYKLYNGLQYITKQQYNITTQPTVDEAMVQHIHKVCQACYQAMDDDFNTPQVIAHLFDLLKIIHALEHNKLQICALNKTAFEQLKNTYTTFMHNILGIYHQDATNDAHTKLMDTLLHCYKTAKENKQYALVDTIRAQLKKQHIALHDSKSGTSWTYEGAEIKQN